MGEEALAFIERNKIVTESAHADVPNFAEFVTGSDVSGSWWSHADSHKIFKLTRMVRESPDVLICRLIKGKITYVHKSIWPVLVRLADEFDAGDLAYIREIHTKTGKHIVKKIPFFKWVPQWAVKNAEMMSREEAKAILDKIINT